MNKIDKILVTGSTGLVGTALMDLFKNEGYESVTGLSTKDCNLINTQETFGVFKKNKPDYVFHLAGYVRGIAGNMANQGDAFYKNTMINTNVVEACRRFGIKKVLAMGSGCIYPDQNNHITPPYEENEIFYGTPHISEYGYAYAKRAMLAQLACNTGDYAYVISGNLYGPNDYFNLEEGHVIPSLIRKFYESDQPVVWGYGKSVRQFMHSYDMARALLLIMQDVNGCVNVAGYAAASIEYIVNILSKLTGKIPVFDTSKPNGQNKRTYNLDKLKNLNFKNEYDLKTGIKQTYDWYAANHETARK